MQVYSTRQMDEEDRDEFMNLWWQDVLEHDIWRKFPDLEEMVVQSQHS